MSEKERQIKNSFTYLIPTVVENILPFLTLPIFTRILMPKDYGILALAQIYAILACGLMNVGLLGIYDRSFFQYRNDRVKSGKLFFSIVLFVLFNYALLIAITFFFQGILAQWVIQSSAFGGILLVTFCAEGAITIRQYYLFFFRNSEDAKKYVQYYIASSVLTFLFSFYFVVFARTGIIGIVYGRLLSNILVLVMLHFNLMRKLPFQFDKEILLSSLKLSWPLTPTIFSGVIAKHLDKYMLGILATIGGVGIYSMGQRVSYALFLCMTSLQNVFQPQTYKRMFEMKEEASRSVGEYLMPFLYICIFIGVLMISVVEEAIWVMMTPAYYGAIDIAIILIMYYGLLFWGKVNSMQMLFAKRTGVISLLTYSNIMINAAVSIPLIIKWGVVGAAWGTLIGGVISGSVTFVVAQRFYKITYAYDRLCIIFGIFFVYSIAMILMRNFGVEYVFRVSFKAIAIALYAYFGVQWRIITKENIMLLRRVALSKVFPKLAS